MSFYSQGAGARFWGSFCNGFDGTTFCASTYREVRGGLWPPRCTLPILLAIRCGTGIGTIYSLCIIFFIFRFSRIMRVSWYMSS